MAANVILAKCSKHGKTFGVRVEKRGNDWVRTWAFPIDEEKAKREGFDKTKINGSLDGADGFPGCPHCGNYGFVICHKCGKMSCINSESTSEHCHFCNTQMEDIKVGDSFSVQSGGY